MRFCPAPPGSGIVFKRTDLAHTPTIPASLEHVTSTNRSTTLQIGDVVIHTVEHVLAALSAYKIDNLTIELSNIEPPIGNGSSDVFVKMIEEAGIVEQDAPPPPVKIEEPVYFSDGDISMVAIPSDEYRISYTLSYPDCKVLGSQFFSVAVTPEHFREEIAPCRTFAKYEEIEHLIDSGLIRGGSLDNAVIIKGDAVISKKGLFFKNEMVRHKILDVIGDLSLIGIPFIAHVIAIRAGHSANVAFGKKLYSYITSKETVFYG